MLSKNLIAVALLAASTGVMADTDTRVYGSVVIADPNFSVAIASGYPYAGPYYWAPHPGGYYYPPKHYHHHHKHYSHHHHNYYKNHHPHYGNDRGDYGHEGRGGWGKPHHGGRP